MLRLIFVILDNKPPSFPVKEIVVAPILFANSASDLNAKWRPDHTLLLTCFAEREARVVTLKGKTRPIIWPDWFGGASTTSSKWDSQGLKLLGFLDHALNLGEPKPQNAFGAK